ncbi:MAG: 16S rRNA (cytidine(1402)-2'-O)-methyltransferase [Clostridiales bacterium]|nr:MAG: 16S rRNA (cytidine(1402)-2'-O)-methyltransferase [Clostridiales bacterium]
MKLIICATPIGNLGDITVRTLETLRNVDLIAAEDTRRTSILLRHYEIETSVFRYDDHATIKGVDRIISEIKSGKTVALVSDAGMPLISDPGFLIVDRCIKEGIEVEVQPGPSALINAVVLSNFNSVGFHFMGFISRKKTDRIKDFAAVKNMKETMVFYESPKRLVKTLITAREVLGNRKVAVFRELTKLYEEHIYTCIDDFISEYKEVEIKGEIVVCIEGCKESGSDLEPEKLLQQYMEEGMSKKDAIWIVSKETGIKKNEIYKLSLKEEK